MPRKTNKDQRHIHAERIEAAAIVYFTEHDKTLQDIADEFDVDRVTFWKWRQTPEWQKAIDNLKSHMRSVAYKRLIQSTSGEPGSPGITAARTLLDRSEGPVEDKLRVNGHLTISDIDGLTDATCERILKDLNGADGDEGGEADD